jgi:hypothetical protein
VDTKFPDQTVNSPESFCPGCHLAWRFCRCPSAASTLQVGGAHYKDFAIQPSEFIHRNNIGFLEGNVIKYVCRHRRKNGRQDIEKAIHYLQLLLEFEYTALLEGRK